MATHSRKQTAVIFVICAFFVGGTAAYVYGKDSSRSGALSTDMKTLIGTTSSDIKYSSDWRGQFLNASTSSAFKVTEAPSDPMIIADKTATDRFNEGFFSKYAELSRVGLTNDPKATANVMSQVISNVAAGIPAPETYVLADISIINATDKATLSNYQSQITNILKNHLPQENEAIVAEQAFADNNMDLLAQIDPIINGYKNIVSGLVKVAVPSPIAQKHLDLINGFSVSVYNAESLRNMDVDPVRGLAAISLEVGGMQNIAIAASGIQAYLTSAGIPPSL